MNIFKNVFIAALYKTISAERSNWNKSEYFSELNTIMTKYSLEKDCKMALNSYLSKEISNHYNGDIPIESASGRELMLFNDSPIIKDIIKHFSLGKSFFKIKKNSHIEHVQELLQILVKMTDTYSPNDPSLESHFNQLISQLVTPNYVSEYIKNQNKSDPLSPVTDITQKPINTLSFDIICEHIFTDEYLAKFITYFGESPPLLLLNIIVNSLSIKPETYPTSYAILTNNFTDESSEHISHFLLQTFIRNQSSNTPPKNYKFDFSEIELMSENLLKNKSIIMDFKQPKDERPPYFYTINIQIPFSFNIFASNEAIFDNIGTLLNFFNKSHSLFYNFDNPFFAKIDFKDKKIHLVIHETIKNTTLSNFIYNNTQNLALLDDKSEINMLPISTSDLNKEEYDKLYDIMNAISYGILKTIEKSLINRSETQLNFNNQFYDDFIQQRREFYLLQKIDDMNVHKSQSIKKKI